MGNPALNIVTLIIDLFFPGVGLIILGILDQDNKQMLWYGICMIITNIIMFCLLIGFILYPLSILGCIYFHILAFLKG